MKDSREYLHQLHLRSGSIYFVWDKHPLIRRAVLDYVHPIHPVPFNPLFQWRQHNTSTNTSITSIYQALTIPVQMRISLHVSAYFFYKSSQFFIERFLYSTSFIPSQLILHVYLCSVRSLSIIRSKRRNGSKWKQELLENLRMVEFKDFDN